ncbi:hypothetical protein [uncultured Senegalimassilia sp.]|uniref:hypothetical protein n=1 Tax=uncultured Senegalimassilia sp. TaxID=1714350 RepID=UPI0025D3049B|nr:hypothetical protein [uncultured Senegalimassilia sp.]
MRTSKAPALSRILDNRRHTTLERAIQPPALIFCTLTGSKAGNEQAPTRLFEVLKQAFLQCYIAMQKLMEIRDFNLKTLCLVPAIRHGGDNLLPRRKTLLKRCIVAVPHQKRRFRRAWLVPDIAHMLANIGRANETKDVDRHDPNLFQLRKVVMLGML